MTQCSPLIGPGPRVRHVPAAGPRRRGAHRAEVRTAARVRGHHRLGAIPGLVLQQRVQVDIIKQNKKYFDLKNI